MSRCPGRSRCRLDRGARHAYDRPWRRRINAMFISLTATAAFLLAAADQPAQKPGTSQPSSQPAASRPAPLEAVIAWQFDAKG
jgi:hypothetical protein